MTPGKPPEQIILKIFIDFQGLYHLGELIVHRLATAEYDWPKPLSKPSPTPGEEKLSISILRILIISVNRFVIGIDVGSLSKRRQYGTILIESDGRRKRVDPCKIAEPFRLAAGTILLFRRFMGSWPEEWQVIVAQRRELRPGYIFRWARDRFFPRG
jgi:hypothetical protein